MTQLKGFTASIYRSDFKDSYSKCKEANNVTIIDKDLPAMNAPDDLYPAVKIVRRNIYGKEYIHAEPVEPGQYAASGSFVYTCDSRFRDLFTYPIPLHDRDMSLEIKTIY